MTCNRYFYSNTLLKISTLLKKIGENYQNMEYCGWKDDFFLWIFYNRESIRVLKVLVYLLFIQKKSIILNSPVIIICNGFLCRSSMLSSLLLKTISCNCVRWNSNRASIGRINRTIYTRLYPVTVVRPDGSSFRIRFKEPRRIITVSKNENCLMNELHLCIF